MKRKLILVLAMASLSLALAALACGARNAAPSGVLADKVVTVGPGGGSVDLYFTAQAGQRLRITFKCDDPGMQPYGYLKYPNGDEQYTPPLEKAQNGQNSADLDVKQGGEYQLSVMDGANKGGPVQVRVEVLP